MKEMPKHSSQVSSEKLNNFGSGKSEVGKKSSLVRVKSPLKSSVSVGGDELKNMSSNNSRKQLPRQASMGSVRPDKPAKPVNRGSTTTATPTPPKLTPRNHPYEKLEGLEVGNPLISSPMPLQKPIPGAKPTPAPRKPSKAAPAREKQYLM